MIDIRPEDEIPWVSHGRFDSKNATWVRIGTLTLFFSYSELVGIRSWDRDVLVTENIWKSSTTSKHLAILEPDRSRWLPRQQFIMEVQKILAWYGAF
jgi:hypothetical protein